MASDLLITKLSSHASFCGLWVDEGLVGGLGQHHSWEEHGLRALASILHPFHRHKANDFIEVLKTSPCRRGEPSWPHADVWAQPGAAKPRASRAHLAFCCSALSDAHHPSL